MAPVALAYEAIDTIDKGLKLLREASKELWDVRIIFEDPAFKQETFDEFKELETAIYNNIESLKDFRERMQR